MEHACPARTIRGTKLMGITAITNYRTQLKRDSFIQLLNFQPIRIRHCFTNLPVGRKPLRLLSQSKHFKQWIPDTRKNSINTP